MVTPSRGQRGPRRTRPFFSLTRYLSPVVSVASVAVLAVSLSSCAPTSQLAAVGESTAATDAAAARMMELAGQHAESFLSHSQTQAIRNMLGGARGVFLVPDVTDDAALIGIERGTGFLLRRHGKDWSDPVFVRFTETSLGYQAGVKQENMLVLLMTDRAVTDVVTGKMELGGTGGFAIGTYGLGVSGTGGIKGGLEMIMLSTNKGAFLGGGWAEAKTALASTLNEEIYGKSADISQILAAPGGKYAPAIKVRQVLSRMVGEAWE
jgi:lipid-binding SYLF domain-containing protein